PRNSVEQAGAVSNRDPSEGCGGGQDLTIPRASRNDFNRLSDHVEVALLNASSYISAALSVALANWFPALLVAAPSFPAASSPRMRARCFRIRARISSSFVPWGTVAPNPLVSRIQTR